MKKEIHKIDFDDRIIFTDIISNDGQAEVLLLHGAGTTNRARYDTFREFLAEKGISSCAMDFIGHGETGGDLKETSLKERTEEVLAVVKSLNIKSPLKIIAFSMSGYTAIKLTEILPIESIVMMAPGVYDANAYNLKFGHGFSEAIRALKSWQNTDVWSILNKFKGKMLIFIGEKDETIPFEIVQKIYDSLVNAKFREISILPNANHPLGIYLKENPDSLNFVIEKIDKFLQYE